MRRRFTPAERAAFTVGAVVQWRNGSHWKDAVVIAPIMTDSLDLPCVPVRITAKSTATLGRGDVVHGYPGNVRLPLAKP